MKRLCAIVVVLAASIAGATAQTYPERPIKVMVPYPAGGPTDTVARSVSQALSTDLGQSVIVENQAGAGGRIAMKAVARGVPDGYTLLLGGTNNNAITPALYKDLDFDAVKDFAPVAAIAANSLVLVVNPSVPAKTLPELITYAKANPGKLTSGGGVGISPHFLLEFVRIKSGTQIQFVPYRGAAPAMTDAISGQIQIHASAKVLLLPQIQAGKLRALVVASAKRWPELPDVPTFKEVGMDGFPDRCVVRPAGACRHAGAGDRQAQRDHERAAEDGRAAGCARQAQPRSAPDVASGVRQRAGRGHAPLGRARGADRHQAEGLDQYWFALIEARAPAQAAVDGQCVLLPRASGQSHRHCGGVVGVEPFHALAHALLLPLARHFDRDRAGVCQRRTEH